MKWKTAGPYAIISECGAYTISQCRAPHGWTFSGYHKNKALVARIDCADSYPGRKDADARIKQACARHEKGKQ